MITIPPQPKNKKIALSLTVPPSKSITQRALITAALADGESRLLNPLESEDTEYTIAALRQLGIKIDTKKSGEWRINGSGGTISSITKKGENAEKEPLTLYLGNNGTAVRFLASIAALSGSPYIIDGDTRMHSRPIAPLVAALRDWGASVRFLSGQGCPPLYIGGEGREKSGGGLAGGTAVLPSGGSSQYLSSLLLAAPYCKTPAVIETTGAIPSKPYAAMTMAVMNDFGISVDCDEEYRRFSIPKGCYLPRDYSIEGDASSASYFWAAAAICGGRVCVENIALPSLQGDAIFAALLGRMGCTVRLGGAQSTIDAGAGEDGRSGITVIGGEKVCGISVDMGDMPDIVPTLAVTAVFAEGVTEITHIGHLRIKECDRIAATACELRKLGVQVEEGADSLTIYGMAGREEELHGAEIETYNDHRIAMSFALAGLRIDGVRIAGEECVAKSFPDFWKRFALLGK